MVPAFSDFGIVTLDGVVSGPSGKAVDGESVEDQLPKLWILHLAIIGEIVFELLDGRPGIGLLQRNETVLSPTDFLGFGLMKPATYVRAGLGGKRKKGNKSVLSVRTLMDLQSER